MHVCIYLCSYNISAIITHTSTGVNLWPAIAASIVANVTVLIVLHTMVKAIYKVNGLSTIEYQGYKMMFI